MEITDNPMNVIREMLETKDYISHEAMILKFWDDCKIPLAIEMMEKQKNAECVNLIDGPPFVSSNKLHFGHLLIAYIKSAIGFWEVLHGRQFKTQIGYDCHGLPIEGVVDEILKVYTREQVEKNGGVYEYNKKCKEVVHSYSNAWTPIYKRIGRWWNESTSYKTMDTKFMETVWWVFKQFWEKGLVEKAVRVMPYSTYRGVPLSNFEAGQCYKIIDTKSVYVSFKVVDTDYEIVAWTTTPWTLPMNMALCVNADAMYVCVETKDKRRYIVSEDCVKNENAFKKLNLKDYTVTEFGKGSKLVGSQYKPLFNYISYNTYVIVADKFVDTKSDVGTGVVHLAAGFGEDDFRVCIENGLITVAEIDRVCPVDENGKYVAHMRDLSGKHVLSVDEDIIKGLKSTKSCVSIYMYKHNYPHCYRTDKPLIYKAISGHFIKVTKIKNEMIANNKKITWHPKHIGEKRFNDWLENARDWCVSRDRYFGTPLPIFASDDGLEVVCFGSIAELMQLTGLKEPLKDIHPEYIKNLTIRSNSGKTLRWVGSVFDCWFESGCVPMAEKHYPFENNDAFVGKNFACDVIAEGLDQTRGWFYTLLVISTVILNMPPAKHIMCTGLILAENGKKFSKSRNNFKDPMEILQKYGADSLRLYLLNSPTIYAEPFLFSENNLNKTKQVLIPWINGMKLFITHGKNYLGKGKQIELNCYKESTNIMDQWIISRLGTTLELVEQNMAKYQLDKAIKACFDFIEDLTNGYIKFNIRRIQGHGDQEYALSTLHFVLLKFCIIMAPFTPFLSEEMYQSIKRMYVEPRKSVHFMDYPKLTEFKCNAQIEEQIKNLQRVIVMVRKMRSLTQKHNSIKVPLKKITISSDEKFIKDVKEFEYIMDTEINSLETEYVMIDDMVSYKMVPNKKNIGTMHKKDDNLVQQILCGFDQDALKKLFVLKGIHTDPYIEIMENPTDNYETKKFKVSYDDFEVERIPSSSSTGKNLLTEINGNLMVTINTEYDNTIHTKYNVRNLIGFVQSLRKSGILKPWNKIEVQMNSSDCEIMEILKTNKQLFENKLKCDVVVDALAYSESGVYEWTQYDDDKIVGIRVAIVPLEL